MSIAVRFECTDRHGWVFVSPWPMTQKAMDNACRKALIFYTRLHADFKAQGRPDDAEAIEKALLVLRSNRVKNVVDQDMVGEFGLETSPRELDVNFPGVPRTL